MAEGKTAVTEDYFSAGAKGVDDDPENPELTPPPRGGNAEGKSHDAGDGEHVGDGGRGESKDDGGGGGGGGGGGAAASSGSGVAAPSSNSSALVPYQDVFGPDPIVKRLCDYWGRVLQGDMDNFFSKHCDAFEPDPDDPQGHKLEYTEIHAKYERIVEAHLRDFVREEGLARPAELYQRLAKVSETNAMAALTVRLVLCASDYQCFVEIMRAKLEHEKRERAWAANEARLAREGKASEGGGRKAKGNIWSEADAEEGGWDEVD